MCPIEPAPVSVLSISIVQAATWDRQSLIELATQVAEKYDLNINHFLASITRESDWDPTIQSGYRNSDGTQEQSYGLCQINITAHPEVTVAEADDPNFCLNFMAQQWAVGNASLWSSWSELKKEYGEGVWPSP